MLDGDQERKILDFVKKHGSAKVDARGEVQVPDRYLRCKHGPSLGRAKGTLAGVYVGEFETPELLAAAVLDHVRAVIIAADEPAKVWLTVYERGATSCTDFIILEIEGGRTDHSEAVAALRDANTANFNPIEAAGSVVIMETLHILKNGHDSMSSLAERMFSKGMETQLEVIELKVERRLLQEKIAYLESGSREAHQAAMMDKAMPLLQDWLPKATDAFSSVAIGYLARGQNADTPCPADPHEAADWHIANAVRGCVGLFSHVTAHPEVLTEERQGRLDKLVEKAMSMLVDT